MVKGIHWQIFERPHTLCESRGCGIDPSQIRNPLDILLENACVDRLSNGDPNCAAHGPKLQVWQRMQQRAWGQHT